MFTPKMTPLAATAPKHVASAPLGFSAKGVNFNGSTYIASTSAAGLSTTDGVKYAASFWYRLLGGNSSYLILFENSSNDGFSLQRDNGNHWEADVLQGAHAATPYQAVASITAYNAPGTADSTWHHMAISADETNSGAQSHTRIALSRRFRCRDPRAVIALPLTTSASDDSFMFLERCTICVLVLGS